MKVLHYASTIAQRAAATRPSVAHSPILRPKCACGVTLGSDSECTRCHRKALRRKGAPGVDRAQPRAPETEREVLGSPGRLLDARVKAAMESWFGHSFSHVRVHTDHRAAAAAHAVAARAFTVGAHIVFGPGSYAPTTANGQRLITHELAHVAQQSGGVLEPPPESIVVGSPGEAAEQEAEAAAAAMAAGHPRNLGLTTSGPALRRTDGPGAGPVLPAECEGERDITAVFRTFVSDIPTLVAALPGIGDAERARVAELARIVLHGEGAADIDHFSVVACASINLPVALPGESMRAFVDVAGKRLALSGEVEHEMNAFRRNPTLEGLRPILATVAHEKRHITIGGAAAVPPTGLRPELTDIEAAQATYRVEEILTTTEEIGVSRKLLGERYVVPIDEQTKLQRLWNIARSRVTETEAKRLRGVIITQLRTRYGFADGCDNALTVGVVSAMETGHWHFCDTSTGRVPYALPAGLNICETDGRHRICPPPRELETVP